MCSSVLSYGMTPSVTTSFWGVCCAQRLHVLYVPWGNSAVNSTHRMCVNHIPGPALSAPFVNLLEFLQHRQMPVKIVPSILFHRLTRHGQDWIESLCLSWIKVTARPGSRLLPFLSLHTIYILEFSHFQRTAEAVSSPACAVTLWSGLSVFTLCSCSGYAACVFQ